MRIAVFGIIAGIIASPLLGQANPSITAKTLVGFWQAGSPDISDAYQDCYRFFPDGKFVFEFSGYDETKRIVSLNGTYSLKDGLLNLLITSRVEFQGGSVARNPQSRSGWCLEKAKLVTVPQSQSEHEEVELTPCSPSPKKHLCITIGGEKYFKISASPKGPK